jgi:hypothetical protein
LILPVFGVRKSMQVSRLLEVQVFPPMVMVKEEEVVVVVVEMCRQRSPSVVKEGV